jgi:hydrogenase maturation protease
MALLMGVGNTLLKDEGIGIHLLNYIHANHSDWETHYGIEFLDGGTLSFDLLSSIRADQELIVLDAVNLNQAPGTVYCLQANAMDNFLSQPGKSVHEVSLLDLLDMSRLSEQLPEKRALIGIQPSTIDWGDSLTEIVEQALPSAELQLINLLYSWGIINAPASSSKQLSYNNHGDEHEFREFI